MKPNTIYTGCCLETLRTFPDAVIDCCVTSPPYYGLRDYGMDAQIGLEQTPEEYISNLVDVFREVKRVLKDDATLWVNIGDSYAGSGNGSSNNPNAEWRQRTYNTHSLRGHANNPTKPIRNIKTKDLIGIPWMLAFALRADGWYLRQDIIWHKPNPMPESVTDRCTKSHEYIILLSKSKTYYFNHEAIQEDADPKYLSRYKSEFMVGDKEISGGGRVIAASNTAGRHKPQMKNLQEKGQRPQSMHKRRATGAADELHPVRNKRDVWTVNIKPCKEAHFAVFPELLIVDCIKAGCPEGGIVLDPFAGSGTTPSVSAKLNRGYVACELNPEYVDIMKNRIANAVGMFQ